MPNGTTICRTLDGSGEVKEHNLLPNKIKSRLVDSCTCNAFKKRKKKEKKRRKKKKKKKKRRRRRMASTMKVERRKRRRRAKTLAPRPTSHRKGASAQLASLRQENCRL